LRGTTVTNCRIILAYLVQLFLFRLQAASMSSEKEPPDDSDKELFRQAMRQVRPLRLDTNRIEPPRRRPPPVPHQTELDRQRVLQEMMATPPDYTEIETGDELLYLRPGVQHSALRKLRRGHYSRGAELDLHGMTVPEAHSALSRFLHRCQANGTGCARIIHGKGLGSRQQKPVLKNRVNLWLRQRDEILAFCSARPEDGGTGAVYILVKQSHPRPEKGE